MAGWPSASTPWSSPAYRPRRAGRARDGTAQRRRGGRSRAGADRARRPGCVADARSGPRAAPGPRDRRPPRRAASAGALLGAPVAVKDIIDAAGFPTTGGGDGWVRMPETDATVVARVRAAGGVVLGKTATNEFAFGIDGTNPHHPPCRHPRDPARLPGGSSSGSTVAVATGQAAVGLGSDTSGSLRVPAALCGVLALRPTPGRVPRDGVLPLAPIYDVVGPIAATHADLARIFAVLAGRAARRTGPCAARARRHRRGAARPGHLPSRRRRRAARGDRAARPGGRAGGRRHRRRADGPQRHPGARGRPARSPSWASTAPGCRTSCGSGPHRRRRSDPRPGRTRWCGAARSPGSSRSRSRSTTCCSRPRRPSSRRCATARPSTSGAAGRRASVRRCCPARSRSPRARSRRSACPRGEVDGLPVGLQIIGPPGSDEMLIALAGRLA